MMNSSSHISVNTEEIDSKLVAQSRLAAHGATCVQLIDIWHVTTLFQPSLRVRFLGNSYMPSGFLFSDTR